MAGDKSYAFTYVGVHEAPNASGLFTIFSPQPDACLRSAKAMTSARACLNFSMIRPRGWIVSVRCRFRLNGCPGPNGPAVSTRSRSR